MTLAAPLLAALLAAGGPRVALLVANDRGFPDEAPLRHTGADAERLAAVLGELGDFAPGDLRILRNRSAAEILDALDELARRPRAGTFLFYYSGHADPAALHPAGTVLPLDLLLHRLRGVGADLRLAILDACHSGAAAKGSRPAAPFALRLEEQGPTGDILISSSADDEVSFESEHGGVFTLHLTAALRGAADGNGDGQVTLGEAYEYAYAQTLRATLAASTGPQHARFRYDLAGSSDPVLTRLAGGALLTLQPQTDGSYVLFDGKERSVVAELPARPGQARRLALAPGGYLVQQRGTRALRSARIELAAGDDRVLYEHQMAETPLLRLARKGSIGERRLRVSAGALGSGLGPAGQPVGALGVDYEGPDWLLGLELAAGGGQESRRGLVTHDLVLLPAGNALRSWHIGSAALRAGPVAGLHLLRQAAAGRPAAVALGVGAGAVLRGDLEVGRGVGLFCALEGRALLVRAGGTASGSVAVGELRIVPWWSGALGLRLPL